MISVEEALATILGSVAPLGAEQVLLDETAGRVVAVAIVAERVLPPWDNSSMDGYAVRAAEVVVGAPLPVAGTVAAGHAPPPLAPGTAVRIMTGAPLPQGADAVVMREHAVEEHGAVRFDRPATPGDDVRRAGEDVPRGALVLDAGALLGPGEIGLLAALGRTVVTVHRRPRVAILSAGDELVDPDRPPGAGQIVGSNAWALAAQCRAAGAVPTILPIAPDRADALQAALEEALRADAVLSSGGVSVGEFDFMKEALAAVGVVQAFWKVAMKPGKPVAFGTRRDRPVFALPGNPASSMVGFELFVRPALRRMLGLSPPALLRPRAPAVLEQPLSHAGPRRHFVRARVRRDGPTLHARPLSHQSSGSLRSMVGTNALLEVPADAGHLPAGTTVTALLLEPV